MKDKLKIAVRAAIIAFVGALAGGAVAPDMIQYVLKLIGL